MGPIKEGARRRRSGRRTVEGQAQAVLERLAGKARAKQLAERPAFTALLNSMRALLEGAWEPLSSSAKGRGRMARKETRTMAEQRGMMSRQSPIVPFGETRFGEIKREGAYVSPETGKLYRVPASAIREGDSPVLDGSGANGDEVVTFVSTNPYAAVEKLRFLSARANIEPTF